MTLVIDANVAAKWYLPEAESPKALTLLGGTRHLIAPSLIKMEVCAAITRRARNKEITAAEARDHCEEWFTDLREDAVQLVPEEAILLRAIELSVEVRHALQDCLYLAVADLHHVPLITADEPFYKKVIAHHPEIHLLAKWRMN
jgi:predicted nucleic acid-binding protein